MSRAVLHGLTLLVVLLALAAGVLRWELKQVFALDAGRLVGIEQLLPGSSARAARSEHGLHGINPYVRITSVNWRSIEGMRASATVVAVELDTFRSLTHFTPILARMELRDATVSVSQNRDGRWQTPRRDVGAGQGGGSRWWRELLWESGRLELADLRVYLTPSRSAAVQLRLAGSMQNVGGAHRADLRLECSGVCGGNLAYNVSGSRLRGMQEGAMTFALRGLPHITGALRIGDAWLDIGESHAAGNLSLHAGRNALQGNLLASARLRSSQGDLDAQLTSRLVGGGEHAFDLQLADLALRLNDKVIPLAGAVLARRNDEWFGRLPDVQIQAVLTPIVAAGVLPPLAAQWLQGLNPRAMVHAARLYFGKDFRATDFAYAATLDSVFVDAHSGCPLVFGLHGRIAGSANAGQLTILPGRMALGFPDEFDAPFSGISIAGPLNFRYGKSGFALHSGLLDVVTPDVRVAGRFALQMPNDHTLQTLTLMLEATNGRAEATPRFLPRVLPTNLHRWLVQAVGAGHVTQGFVGLHTYVSPAMPHAAAVELAFDVDHTAFKFLPDWPRLDNIVGRMTLSNGQLMAAVSNAVSGGVRVVTGQMTMRAHDPHLTVAVRGVANPSGVTDFLLHSPLGTQLSWLADWQGNGDFDFDLRGKFALEGDAHEMTVNARNTATALHNDKLHVALSGVAGAVKYVFPRQFTAANVRANLNQKPVVIDIKSTPNDVSFSGRGRGDGAWLSHWLPWPLEKVTSGAFNYTAGLTVHTGAALPHGTPTTALDVQSDFAGFALNLPAPLVKPAAALRALKFHLDAIDDVLRVRVAESMFAFRGELRAGTLTRGVLGVGALGVSGVDSAADTVTSRALSLPERGLVIGGNPDAMALFGWGALLSGGGGPNALPLSVDLDVGQLLLNDAPLPKARLRVLTRVGGWRVDVDQSTLAASLQIFQDRRPMQLTISKLRLPRAATSSAPTPPAPKPPGPPQPLLAAAATPDVPDALIGWPIKLIPQMSVSAESLLYGDEPLGKLRFDLQPTADGIELQGLTGVLRNVAFSGARLTWQRDARGDRTRVAGLWSGKDVAPLLAAFGFAGSMKSEAITLKTDLGWTGSPANYALRRLEGVAHLSVKNGQFVQVQGANAARVLGVFDFASIARRARLDFSDVFGKGLSFDSIDADLRFSAGMLSFPNTLRVEGPGSAFRVGGTVNLNSGALDNDMIVTLPLSRTLPWYAAYAVFTANPLAGAGVLVAERLLHDRLDRFSSAKYHVDGTIDEPQVKFVAVFNNQLDQPRVPANSPVSGPVIAPLIAPSGGRKPAADAAATGTASGKVVAPLAAASTTKLTTNLTTKEQEEIKQ